MFEKFIDFAYDLLPQYLADVEKEKPNLILYDGLSFTTKYLFEIIKARNAKGDMRIRMPKTAAFAPLAGIMEFRYIILLTFSYQPMITST